MGLLSRFTSTVRGGGSLEVTAVPLAAGSLLSVVGESYYKPALDRTAAMAVRGTPPLPVGGWVANDVAKREPDLPWFQAVLVREPDNPYDPNAIAVYSPAGKIGHLSREDAEEYQDVLIAVENGGAHAGACSAFLRRANNGNWRSCWRCRRQISVLKRWRRKRARSFSLPRFVSRWLPWPLFPAFRNQFNRRTLDSSGHRSTSSSSMVWTRVRFGSGRGLQTVTPPTRFPPVAVLRCGGARARALSPSFERCQEGRRTPLAAISGSAAKYRTG